MQAGDVEWEHHQISPCRLKWNRTDMCVNACVCACVCLPARQAVAQKKREIEVREGAGDKKSVQNATCHGKGNNDFHCDLKRDKVNTEPRVWFIQFPTERILVADVEVSFYKA